MGNLLKLIKNRNFNFIYISFLFFLFFWVFFLSLQNKSVYNIFLKPFARNYIIENEEKKLVKTPYIRLTDKNYIQWDGTHYKFIKENGYNIEKAGGDYIFAFFPLFPLIWKFSTLPSIGIIFLNYLSFTVGIYILFRTFKFLNNKLYLLVFCLPGLVVFLLPYTEAMFFLFLAIGINGFYRNKYWVFFTGFALASMARPSAILLIASFIGVELFYTITGKRILQAIKSIIINTLPAIFGTLCASLYQLGFKSGSLIKFIEVQSRWDKSLTLPQTIIDWSHEGFSLNFPFLIIIFPVLISYFTILFFARFSIEAKSNENKLDYLKLLSIFFLVFSTLTTVLYQNGSLNGLFRYTMCTPFFLVLFISFYSGLTNLNIRVRFFILLTLFIIVAILLTIIPYSSKWNFSDLGFLILILFIGLWFFNEVSYRKLYKIILYITLFLNILWTSYLFNTYISNGWIFT